jgi:hypothetical protein
MNENETPDINTNDSSAPDQTPSTPAPQRRGGRKPGSVNKPKSVKRVVNSDFSLVAVPKSGSVQLVDSSGKVLGALSGLIEPAEDLGQLGVALGALSLDTIRDAVSDEADALNRRAQVFENLLGGLTQ